MQAQEKQVEVEIIPVIDLLNGCVVHAQRGQRSHYRPIKTPLCDSSSPLDVVNALLKLYPFRQLYIADLNAIQQQGSNAAIVRSIKQHHPQLDIWLDGGFRHHEELQAWQEAGVTCVLGSENMTSLDQFVEMTGNSQYASILSLDFAVNGYMGPVELHDRPHLWPEKVVAMTLGQVGSNLGPDLLRLQPMLNKARNRKPAPRIYAAGGIRNLSDTAALGKMGVAGVLVATALHNGSITPADLACLEA
jgi:phosphoribosylformimino-5-aminoimidazole carboxamide ribotide isomerase